MNSPFAAMIYIMYGYFAPLAPAIHLTPPAQLCNTTQLVTGRWRLFDLDTNEHELHE